MTAVTDRDPCVTPLGTLTHPGTQVGAWTAGCPSTNRRGSHAHFYSFTLEQEGQVAIDLTSDADTYLFLMEAEGRDGALVASSDDASDSVRHSRISHTLAAGNYTIEATTYSPATTGDFTLNIAVQESTPSPVAAPGPGSVAPLPTEDPCVLTFTTLTESAEVEGEWTSSCTSTNRSGRYARFYTFTLAEETGVAIELASQVDTYLFLLEDADRTAEFRTENDVVETGNTNSRIVESLEAGTYTVEATTYSEDVTGSFTLSVADTLAGSSTPHSDACVDDLGIPVTPLDLTGAWADDCDSTNRSGRNARFYTFVLETGETVTIDLTSSEDPYLYLLQGAGRHGAVADENDDIETGVNSNSRIVETLAAGAYTIEATTYGERTTGDFAMSVAW